MPLATVDLNNGLCPALLSKRTFWALDPALRLTSVVDLLHVALGSFFSRRLGVADDPGAVARELQLRYENDPRFEQDEWTPMRVHHVLSLQGRPGAVLLDVGASTAAAELMVALSLAPVSGGRRPTAWRTHSTVRLEAGQMLMGVSAAAGGSAIRYEGPPGSAAIELAGNGSGLMDLAVSTTRDVAVGIEVSQDVVAGDLSRVSVTGFRTAVRIHGSRARVRAAALSGSVYAVDATADSSDVLVLGSSLSVKPREAGSRVARMDGARTRILRSRLELASIVGAGNPQPAVEVTGSHGVISGCLLHAVSSTGPLIRIDGAERTLLERNTYGRTHDEMGAPRPGPGEPARPVRAASDHGRFTAWRDQAALGFPAINQSTHSVLENGSFERVENAGARSAPLGWTLHPAGLSYGSLREFRGGAIALGQPTQFFADVGRAPERASFLGAVDDATDLFSAVGGAHHGRYSAWLGARSNAKVGTVLRLVQSVRVDATTHVYTLSGFLAAPRGSAPRLRVTAPDGLRFESAPYDGRGDWQQRTVSIPPHPGRGPVTLEVACELPVIRSIAPRDQEAYFDQLVLVAGGTVPLYAERQLADEGGAISGGLVLAVGRGSEIRLDACESGPRRELSASASVVAACELVDEGRVLVVASSGGDTHRNRLLVDLRRNGKAMSVDGHPVEVHLEQRGESLSVGRIPLAALSPSSLALAADDYVVATVLGGVSPRSVSLVLPTLQREL